MNSAAKAWKMPQKRYKASAPANCIAKPPNRGPKIEPIDHTIRIVAQVFTVSPLFIRSIACDKATEYDDSAIPPHKNEIKRANINVWVTRFCLKWNSSCYLAKPILNIDTI